MGRCCFKTVRKPCKDGEDEISWNGESSRMNYIIISSMGLYTGHLPGRAHFIRWAYQGVLYLDISLEFRPQY